MEIKSEWDILAKIKSAIDTRGVRKPPRLIMGIGDDCAVFEVNGDRYGLITTDISIEDRHFRRALSSPQDIGFKAMMSNISDIASMGGAAQYAFISIGIPQSCAEEYVLALYDGMIDAANMAGVALAGGDISKSAHLVLNIALYGEARKRHLTTRSGAKPGDIIYLTGALGDSRAGLEILLSGETSAADRYPALMEKHNRPVARFGIVTEIIQMFNPTSMIDVSDGVLSELWHICEESKCGFRLIEDKIPLSADLRRYAAEKNRGPLDYALHSGEEYELLFTSPKDITRTMSVNINKIPVTVIGSITEKGFVTVRNSREAEAPISGFDHFREQ